MLTRGAKCLKVSAIVFCFIAAAIVAYPSYLLIKAELAQLLLRQAWQQSLFYLPEKTTKTSHVKPAKVKPWPWADIYPVGELLNHKTGKGYIVINNDSGSALAFGPGLHGVSAQQNQQVIISGHNDSHFSWLAALEHNDKLSVSRLGFGLTTYYVREQRILDLSKEKLMLDRFNDEANNIPPRLILVTCYPFNSVSRRTPLRYIVYAEAVTVTP